MSRMGVEKALYDLNTDRHARRTFVESPGGFAAQYRLTGDELRLLTDRDVRALVAYGANPMLVWGFWLMLPADGERGDEAYLARMRGGTPASGDANGE